MQVDLFFTESPTNPFLRCVDIELVSKLCREKGALVCIDGTFATPLNQKALALGADLVVHSATKFLGGHNDVSGIIWLFNNQSTMLPPRNIKLTAMLRFIQVLAGCISGPEKLVSVIRNLHHILGGALNPVSFLN